MNYFIMHLPFFPPYTINNKAFRILYQNFGDHTLPTYAQKKIYKQKGTKKKSFLVVFLMITFQWLYTEAFFYTPVKRTFTQKRLEWT